MTWDSQNRMVSCAYSGNTLAFDYGSDGLRRSETLTSGGQSVTTYYVYDGQSLVMEETKNAQGVLTPSASYLNGPRGPEYRKDETTGLVKWYLYDGLGSVIGEVDPSGNMTYSAKYDVYGSVRGTTGTATSAQGFVGGLGHLSEAATGLIYMRARYYDPSTGRFVSEDEGRQGENWYTYCDDNPVNEIDGTGRVAGFVTVGVMDWINSILINAGVDFTGVAALKGMATEDAIDWVEAKIAQLEASISGEAEVAGIEIGKGEGETAEGDDLDGSVDTMGGGLSAEDAARRAVAIVELGEAADFMVMSDGGDAWLMG